MKEKLTRNIGLKILSIILAVILWLVITNVDDPMEAKKFRDVPVEILNANVISSLEKIYDISEGETIDFTVMSRRSISDNLTVSDFKVTADFAHLSSVNAVNIDITCPRYGDEVTVTDGRYQTMKVKLEDKAEEHYKVNVILKGEVAEGYYVGEKSASPNIIRVSGPKSKIERIADIIVESDVSEVSTSFHTIGEPKALDEDGKDIDTSNLTFSESYVTVNVGIYKTKKINLQITATGQPASGYIMTGVEYEPKSIEVAGEDDLLKRINYLSITESISGLSQSISKEINLQNELQEGIYLVGEDQNAVINITIEKIAAKDIALWQGDIETRNMPDHLKLSLNTAEPIIIRVSGPAKEIDKITKTSLKPYIDLSNYSIGTYSTAVGGELPNMVTIVNNPLVSITLSQ